MNKFALRHPLKWLAWRLTRPVHSRDVVPPTGYGSWADVRPTSVSSGARVWEAGKDDVVEKNAEINDNISVLMSTAPDSEGKRTMVVSLRGDETCIKMVSPQDFGITSPKQLEAIAAGKAKDWGTDDNQNIKNVPLRAVVDVVKSMDVKTEDQALMAIRILENVTGKSAEQILADARTEADRRQTEEQAIAAYGQNIQDSTAATLAVGVMMGAARTEGGMPNVTANDKKSQVLQDLISSLESLNHIKS